MINRSEFKIEWLFINLRWFLLLAVAAVIGLDVALTEATFPRTALLLLIVGGIANLTALIVLMQGPSARLLRDMMLLHDILLTLGFIAASRGLRTQLLFVSLVPIIGAALRISYGASIWLTLGVVGSYWGIGFLDGAFNLTGPPEAVLYSVLPYVTSSAILLVAGLTVSRVGVKIKQALLADREEREKKTQNALRLAHHRASIIFELASTLSATLNYQRVLEAALDISHAGLQEFFADPSDFSQVGMILLFRMDKTLRIAKARGISLREEQTRFAAERGVLAKAVVAIDPIVTNEPAEDPELRRIGRFRECQQAIVVPLRAGFESYGLLVLGSTEPDLYTADFQQLLVAICNQAVLALQNANLYQNLIKEKDRLVNVEEDARKKLARDLHDGPTQTIAAIAMRLNYIQLLVNENPDAALEELSQLEDLARRTTKEIRQMLFTLRPLILESQGLIAAIRQLRQKISETDVVPIHLEADPVVEELLSKDAKGAIFYIVQEATTNARKHSEADNIWIRLYPRSLNVIAEVEDDGKGFDISSIEADYASRGSLGMTILRERATLVKGKTVIRSTPGEGTKITVTVPRLPPQERVPTQEGETAHDLAGA
ncbi:MAG: GAF domain-containing sensor histidine kinase [Anaerolineae bacterium]